MTNEELDPQSTLHVISDDGITFLTYPPTSGPHVGAPPLSGALAEPIAGVRQVSTLEHGRVIVQYSEDVSADDVAALESLAGDVVIVAPALPEPDLPAPIVATAWRHKQLCSAVDLPTLQAFADEHHFEPIPHS